MGLKKALEILATRWRIVALALVVVTATGLVYGLARPKEYTADLTFYVAARTDDSATAAYQGNLLSQQRVTSYTQLITNPRVLSEVIERLHLPTTPQELSTRIKTSSTVESVIIGITVTEPDPELAASVANTLGSVFTELVDQLETPISPGQARSVTLRIVEPAVAPLEPSSASPASVAVFALVAGLIVGVFAALLWELLDTRVRSAERLSEISDIPNLGAIGIGEPSEGSEPVDLLTAPSGQGEALRRLRTNLQFVDVDREHKVLVVTSPKPGDGKTSLSINIARVLAASGQKVVLVEADLRKPTFAERLGLEKSVGLTNVLSNRVRLEGALQHMKRENIQVLVSGPIPANPSELLGSNQMKSLLDQLRATNDIVLVDTPPLLPVADTAALAPSVDGTILVCRANSTKVSDVRGALESLRAVSAHVSGTVINMVKTPAGSYYSAYGDSRITTPAPVDPAGWEESTREQGGAPREQGSARRPVPFRRG